MGTVGTDGSNWLQIMSSKNNTQVSLCQRMRMHRLESTYGSEIVSKAKSFLKFEQNRKRSGMTL